MSEERVVLTASLRDELSAPLANVQQTVKSTARAVQRASADMSGATRTSSTSIMTALSGQETASRGLAGAWGRLTGTARTAWAGARNAVVSAGSGIEQASRQAGERSGKGLSDGFKESLKGLAAGALAAFGIHEVAARANEAVGSFSELEDSSAAAGVVFGDSMQKIIDQSKGADKALGLSQQAVINGANTFGTYGKAAGLGGDKLAGFATGLTGLAGDMASFKGTSTEQALEAIAAGLRGEAEPLRAYGVMLDDVQMRNQALKMGLIKTTKDALTPQQKVLAAQALIFAQTKDAQGDFARTSQSTANIAKTLSAASENLSAKVGKVLAPAFTAARKKALGMVSGLSGFIDNVQKAQDVISRGGSNKDIAKALGLTPEATKVFSDIVGPIRAFFSAFNDGSSDVTSSGVAGVFEQLGGVLGRVVGGLQMGRAEVVNIGNDIDPLVKSTFDLKSKLVDVVKWLWNMRGPITIIAGLIVGLLIPHFVRLGIESLQAAGKVKLAWVMKQKAAIQSTYKQMWGFGVTIAGWVLTGTQATLQALKIAAAWVIAMGPVAWIVAGIAALVAGLVWAYNNVDWFRAGVDAAFRWIGDVAKSVVDWVVGAWSNIVDWWNATLMPAIQAVGKWFGDLFTNVGNWARDFVGFFVDGWGMIVDFFNGVLVPAVQAVGAFFAPVFDWIGRLVWNFATIAVFLFRRLVDFWNGVLMPALQNLGNFIGTIFTWIYTTLIKPYIDLIVGAFNGVVAFWNDIFMPGLQALGNFIGTIFSWIYNVLIKPAVDGIVAGFRGLVDLWNGVLMPALQALGDFIGAVMTWIYTTLVKPVIDLLVGAFGMLVDFWNNTLSPVMTSVGQWFSDTIGGAINGVKGFIDDLVKNFQTFMTFVSDKLQPIVDGIAGAFKTVSDAIGVVLDKIGQFANNPLGGIQDLLGIQKDGNGQGVMPGASGGGVFSGGGVIGYAGGGTVLGGYEPGRDRIPAMLSAGESVLVPELTRAIGPSNIMAANYEASNGRAAGSGPALVSGFSNNSGAPQGGGAVVVAEGAVQITIQAGPNGLSAAQLAQVRAAVEQVFRDAKKRSY
ncbi:tape measure protein [Arthrobacter phage Abba]|uniref:Tape measure protein n=1 Tax=Arthrobacter phage Abba TaxID=2713256 RepID=A0A6G8R2B9_9CAUD|nr:tail length tape measure protein [Arthrobacter phage Abba]QIN94347.1 tape measure protein [Arthrobacter phage Abba]